MRPEFLQKVKKVISLKEMKLKNASDKIAFTSFVSIKESETINKFLLDDALKKTLIKEWSLDEDEIEKLDDKIEIDSGDFKIKWNAVFISKPDSVKLEFECPNQTIKVKFTAYFLDNSYKFEKNIDISNVEIAARYGREMHVTKVTNLSPHDLYLGENNEWFLYF